MKNFKKKYVFILFYELTNSQDKIITKKKKKKRWNHIILAFEWTRKVRDKKIKESLNRVVDFGIKKG